MKSTPAQMALVAGAKMAPGRAARGARNEPNPISHHHHHHHHHQHLRAPEGTRGKTPPRGVTVTFIAPGGRDRNRPWFRDRS
ncbi:hypothetical protein ZHAS_00003353 [Anopheles sinensis]|uniref:Uncharacterized protein n=1 Tax=Anopheles sinensis TaxID=74873 RepID=A0A084VE25_ANOSI|nr:hypothetical protein ZHAS_00003353 [Anopheles sinensis]